MCEDKKNCCCEDEGCCCGEHEHHDCDCGHDCHCEESEFITLTDEDGVQTDFEVIEGLEHNGNMYLALTEAATADADNLEFIILKAVEEDGESLLTSIDNEEEFNTVLELMQAKIENAGLFDFEAMDDAE